MIEMLFTKIYLPFGEQARCLFSDGMQTSSMEHSAQGSEALVGMVESATIWITWHFVVVNDVRIGVQLVRYNDNCDGMFPVCRIAIQKGLVCSGCPMARSFLVGDFF